MVPLVQLSAALVREANPSPLKYALSLCGLMSPGYVCRSRTSWKKLGGKS